MKLTIGENIRNFRKKNDLTQEDLADRLGVTYQSISRWENGTTYPDLELMPAIAEILAVTVDELLGMPQIQKEKRAAETFDELRRECMKHNYDADVIINLLRDIRRNYLKSDLAWRPWVDGNGRAFSDPKILPEVRLLAEAFFENHPMDMHVIRTMACVEDEENLGSFLEKYTTPHDCSERALLFRRYLYRGDDEKFEVERRYQLFNAIDTLFSHHYLVKRHADTELINFANEFMEKLLTIIRCDVIDDGVDIWVTFRLETMVNSAARSVAMNNFDEAISKLESAVTLMENAMTITDEVVLPTSCRFLEGMECRAMELWRKPNNNPDSLEEKCIFMELLVHRGVLCYSLSPRDYLEEFESEIYAPLHKHPQFEKLCERVRKLIMTNSNGERNKNVYLGE